MTLPMFPNSANGNPQVNPENIRKAWHKDEWYFSIIDIIAELLDIDYKRAKFYWAKLKERLSKQEGNETLTNCHHVEIAALAMENNAFTDVVNTEQTLRLIQSIPSPKAEPFKIWLAQVGAERWEEERADPEEELRQALERVGGKYRRAGKTESWIEARIQGIITRKQFVEALKAAVINAPGTLYGQATDKLYQGLWERTTAQLRGELNLHDKENPRDHFGEYALIYTRLAEMVCTDKLDKLEIVPLSLALEIVWSVALLIHQQAAATAHALGMDLVTERPLLPRSNG
ncbi:MAG: Bro-N domain-containing protein [Anaerolineae bacterium]